MPLHIFGYALLLYLQQIASYRRTIAVDEILYKPGSPGQAFKLDENSLMTYLEALESVTDGQVRLHETAGLRQLYLHYQSLDDMAPLALELLRLYYR